MPNIPIRERPVPPQKTPPRQVQYNTAQIQNIQSRQAQSAQRPQPQQPRSPQTPQVRTGTPHPSAEQLRPMKPNVQKLTPKKSTTQAKTKKHPQRRSRKKRDRSTMGDFLLSFIVALFVFGVAAIFVCNALISLFAS